MNLKVLPPQVRVYLYIFWVGMGIAGIGVVGFFLSFWQVGSAAQAAIDVHDNVPVFAYASILAWVVGLIVMWYGRRRLTAALAAKQKESRSAILVDDAPAGRDA
ncbi:MAG: hypothetical protein JXA36_03900 [Coriobacteriia bacterium]|nr:hypothetical protein [Coriobacteriia bacterium]